MAKCELCNSSAKTYCESDQARLCWDCDAKVHGANFLVAKHSRTLLCNLCYSYTPWAGSGPKLTPTVSACNSCNGTPVIGDVEEKHSDGDTDIEGDDDEEDEDSDISIDDEDDEKEDNQVVPGSSMSAPADSNFSSSGVCPGSDEGAS